MNSRSTNGKPECQELVTLIGHKEWKTVFVLYDDIISTSSGGTLVAECIAHNQLKTVQLKICNNGTLNISFNVCDAMSVPHVVFLPDASFKCFRHFVKKVNLKNLKYSPRVLVAREIS